MHLKGLAGRLQTVPRLNEITIFTTLSEISHLMFVLFAVDHKLSHEISSHLIPSPSWAISFASPGAHKKVILIFHLSTPSNKTAKAERESHRQLWSRNEAGKLKQVVGVVCE